jgi:hypothetical protein
MTQADRVLSTPPTNSPIAQVDATTRRRFLSQTAGIAAGGAVLALATISPAAAAAAPAGTLDPVFGLIQAHRSAQATYLVALAEQTRLEELDVPKAYLISDAPCGAQIDAFNDLVGTAPTTVAGLQAWASYLGEFMNAEDWLFEEAGPTFVATVIEAAGNLAVAS